MSTKKWILGIPAAILLLAVISGILFPRFWLRIIKPVKFEIREVKMKVDPQYIDLDFTIVLTRDYLINFALDSLAYEIYFDSIKFSAGGAAIKRQLKDGESDTLRLPLRIDRGTLKDKIRGDDMTEMVKLQIILHSYVDLKFAGKTNFDTRIERLIHTPQPPQISVINVEKNIEGLNDANVNIDFELANPNNYEFTIVRIEATLDFKDLFTGKAHAMDTIHVPANGTAYFKALVDINDLELIRDGLRVVFRPNKLWPYTIIAKLYIYQEDSAPMLMEVEHSGAMELMGRRKEYRKGE